MRMRVLCTVVLGGLVFGCDSESMESDAVDDGYLDREIVDTLPEGDAVGDGFSGAYETRSTTISCAGMCGPITVGSTTYAVCDRDAESVEWVVAYQEDGRLRVDLDDDGHIGINLDGYVPVRLLGGIDADGSWDVGGYDTKFEGRLESTARARGTVDVGAPLEGTLEVHTVGAVGDAETDCHMTHRLVSLGTPE